MCVRKHTINISLKGQIMTKRKQFLKEVEFWKILGLSLPISALFIITIAEIVGFKIWVDYLAYASVIVFFMGSAMWWWWAINRFKKIYKMLDDSEIKIINLKKQIKEEKKFSRYKRGFNGK